MYAVSGIAVNHIDEWNPNYDIHHLETTIEPIDEVFDDTDELAREVLRRLQIDTPYKSVFLPDPQSIRIFLDGHTVTANYHTGRVQQEIVNNRPILRWLNFLHLNEAKQLWTYVADMFALALIVVAVTGLFIAKGSQGITGRGAWLTAIGFLLPLLFLWLYF